MSNKTTAVMTDLQKEAINTLHARNCSCVIAKNGTLEVFHGRGVSDLFRLLKNDPTKLENAFVADKVVGKGAAALMILGKITAVYADMISDNAVSLLSEAGVAYSYGKRVPDILNRDQSGFCPVETLCRDCRTAQQCLPLIEDFVAKMMR